MDKQTAVKQVLAAYEKLIGADKRIKALEKKLADGTITLRESAELNDLRARAFSKAFSGKVLDIVQGEREGTCTALLCEGCNDVDELAQAAQRAVLARQGLNLTPPTASFEEKRVYKVAHSLEDTTVPDETIERRARSATENVLRSQYDRNMKKGAETCSAAGLKTYIIRDSGAGCCKWCDEVSGKFAYGAEPKDVYRRHDNCTCTVVYESGRGRQNVWSKQYWSAEQEREYLRLRDEMAPKRLNAKQAQALRERVGGLTFGGKSATMYYEHITEFGGSEKLLPATLKNLEKAISPIPDKLQTALSKFGVQIRVDPTVKSNGYSPDIKEIRLRVDNGANSIVHELGHALEDMLKVYEDPRYISILEKGLNLDNWDNVEFWVSEEDKNTIFHYINNPKFVNEYQGRVYLDPNEQIFDGKIDSSKIHEYFSEGFRAFFDSTDSKKLKARDPELYKYLEDIINGYK